MELLGAYYPKDYIFRREALMTYMKALYTMRHFRHDALDPEGEDGGTVAGLEVTGDVSGDLEEMVADMVQGRSSKRNTKFDYKALEEEVGPGGSVNYLHVPHSFPRFP